MKLWKKLLIGISLFMVLVVATLILLVQVFVTPERIREQLQVGLQTALHREVTLGRVEVGLLHGIRVEALEVRNLGATEPLLTADRIELSYNLLSMLRGVARFGEVKIITPRLRLERDVAGRLNIADLLGAEDARVSPAVPAESGRTEPNVSTETSVSPVPLIVDKFVLQDGDLYFVDRSLNTQAPYLYRLENLKVQVEAFSLTDPFPARVEARLNGAPLAVNLTYSLPQGLQRLQFKGTDLDLVPLAPYFKAHIPGSLRQGLLSSNLDIALTDDGLSAKGQLRLENVDLTIDQSQPLRWKGLRAAIDLDLVYRYADQVLDAHGLLLDLYSARAEYRGKVLLSDQPRISGSGSLEVTDLRRLVEVLPLALQPQLEVYGLSGSLRADGHFGGTAGDLASLRDLKITLSDLQAGFSSLRPALSGALDYADERLQGKEMVLKIKGQELKLALDVQQVLSPLPRIQLILAGDSFNLDPLLDTETSTSTSAQPMEAPQLSSIPSVQAQLQAKQVQPQPAQAAQDAEPLVLPFQGGLDVRLAKLLYRGLAFRDVKAKLQMQPRRVQLDSFSAGFADGTLQLTGEALPANAGLPYSGDYAVADIAVATLADVFIPQGKGSIRGQLTAKGRFGGTAQSTEPLATLQTSGTFDLREGEVKGSPLFDGLASFLTNPELQVISFRRFAGDYSLKAGQGTIDAQLESRRLHMQPKGSFSLAGPLNLSLETYLAPELANKSGVGGTGGELLKDDQGWSLLPLKVKGTYTSPRFTLDARATREQVQKGLSRELGRKLQEKLGVEPDRQSEDPVKQLMDGALKKLFGK